MGLKRFDYKLKDNSKKKSIIVASIIVLVLLIGVTIYATYAEYKDTKTYNIIQGKVGEFINGDVKISVVAIDTEGKETSVSDFPSYLEYNFLADQSSCTNGSTIEFDEVKWAATISSSGKDTCTLKFEHKTLANAIKANTTLVETTPDFNEVTADGEYGLYSAADDDGTSYYFRGDVENNYVKFGVWKEDYFYYKPVMADGSGPTNEFETLEACEAQFGTYEMLTCTKFGVPKGSDMYWRIVRVNGDGTIRLVYDGTEKVANGVAHTAIIATTLYNTNYNDPKYLGYTYDDGTGKQVDSTIKSVVDAWYENNLEADYGKYIADSIFCNDREVSSSADYRAYERLVKNKSPKLSCTQDADKYTISSAKGNGLLTKPVGLLTADEMAMAGAKYGTSNSNFYLYTGKQSAWLMTSSSTTGISVNIFYAKGDGSLNTAVVADELGYSGGVGARPVINLDSNIKMYGSGTISDPYRLTKEL